MSDSYRYEIKFVLNEVNESVFEKWFYSETSFTKKYPNRFINSLYLDDINFNSVKDNLSGIANRHKLRLRWYGNTSDSECNKPTLEKKLKNGRLGTKEYTSIIGLEDNIYTSEIRGIFNEIIRQYNNEGIGLKDFYFPTLLVSYEREYFEDVNNLRVTIDKDIRYSAPTMSKTINNHDWISHNKKILELKFEPQAKDYVSELIRPLNLVPSRHSKYLTGLSMLGQANYL